MAFKYVLSKLYALWCKRCYAIDNLSMNSKRFSFKKGEEKKKEEVIFRSIISAWLNCDLALNNHAF